MSIRRWLFLAVCVAVWITPLTVTAQSDDETPPHPLIEMLSMVPAEAAVAQPDGYIQIQWADIRANEQARPGVPTPPDSATLWEMPEEAVDLWAANMNRLIGIAPDIRNLQAFDAEMVDYLGFDLLEIDRTLYFGQPPQDGVIYAGHFDPQRITDTLVARTYTTTTLNELPALCGPVGCENGLMHNQWLPDQEGRDPVTLKKPGVFMIFKGHMGRQEPIAFVPGAMLNSPDWGLLSNMAVTGQGSHSSLYDLPDYRAIADFAVAERTEGPLIQVLYLDPSLFSASDYQNNIMLNLATFGGDFTQEELQLLAERLGVEPDTWADLPLYPLAALVDRQDGPDQVHYLVLAYDNEADAQQAAEVVTRRLPELSALLEWRVDEPLLDLLDSYTIEPGRVVHAPDTDRWLAVATLRVPLPANELDPEENSIPASGRALALCYRAILSGYFTPLMVVP